MPLCHAMLLIWSCCERSCWRTVADVVTAVAATADLLRDRSIGGLYIAHFLNTHQFGKGLAYFENLIILPAGSYPVVG